MFRSQYRLRFPRQLRVRKLPRQCSQPQSAAVAKAARRPRPSGTFTEHMRLDGGRRSWACSDWRCNILVWSRSGRYRGRSSSRPYGEWRRWSANGSGRNSWWARRDRQQAAHLQIVRICMSRNIVTSEAMRPAHRLSLILMIFLFLLAEGIALSNFWERREMHVDIYSASLIPMLIAIPLAAWIQIRRRIRNTILDPGVNQTPLLNVQYWLTSLTLIFYAILTLTMSLLLNAVMHLRHQ